jgi:protein-glutamine gamma-glutamyltransferase
MRSAASHNSAAMPPAPNRGHDMLAAILSRYFEASLYLMLYTAVLTLVATGKLDLFTTAAAPAALVWKGFRRWRGYGPELTARAATICMVGYFLLAPADYLWARSRAADAPNPALYAGLLITVHLLLVAMMARLYSSRERRDSLFLAMLGFASMLAAAVLTVDTAYLIFLMIFLALAVSTFIGLEMQRGAEGATLPPMDSGSPPARRLVRALSLTSGAVAAAALLLGGPLFFILPRVSAGYFSGYALRPQLMTGFTDSVELGQIGEIQKSAEVVMRVKINGDLSRFNGQHWRGVALINFDGHRWSDIAVDRHRIFANGDGWFFLQNTRAADSPAALHYSVLLEPVATDAVFVAPGATAVRGDFSSASGLTDATHRNFLIVDGTSSIYNPFPNYSQISYEASSLPPDVSAAELRRAGTDYPPRITSVYLQLPSLDPRIPQLARQVATGATTPYDQAMAVEGYLQTHYTYTLDMGLTPPHDPLAYFLFERRKGHCEYFASAMAILLRALGIPTRYINGFQAGEYNDVGGDFIVRASDAHSWVEAYFPGHGWITFDPTPAGETASSGWFSGAAKYLDWMQLKWGEWVINYDFLHQAALGQSVSRTSRQWASSARERSARFYDAAVAGMRRWQARAAAWPGTPLVVALVVIVMVFSFAGDAIRKRLTKFWNLHSKRGRLSPGRASEHYREMLRILARRGYRKAEGATPLEFVASIPRSEVAVPVGRLTDLYQSARFGAASIEPHQSIELLRQIKLRLSSLPRQS